MKHLLPATLLIAVIALLAGCKSPEERAMDRFDRQMQSMERMMEHMEKRMNAAAEKE